MNLYSATCRRAKLIRAARRAFVLLGEACELLTERRTALQPSRPCIDEARRLAQHRRARFNRLEAVLASECGLPDYVVYNALSTDYPVCPSLVANLQEGLRYAP